MACSSNFLWRRWTKKRRKARLPFQRHSLPRTHPGRKQHMVQKMEKNVRKMKTNQIKNKTAGETRVLRDHIYLLGSCGAWRKEAVTVAEFALWKKNTCKRFLPSKINQNHIKSSKFLLTTSKKTIYWSQTHWPMPCNLTLWQIIRQAWRWKSWRFISGLYGKNSRKNSMFCEIHIVDGWNPSFTSWYGNKYPILYRVLDIPGGVGFLPSTVPTTCLLCHLLGFDSFSSFFKPSPEHNFDGGPNRLPHKKHHIQN